MQEARGSKRYQLISDSVKRLYCKTCGENFESEIQILRYNGRFYTRNLLLISEMKIFEKKIPTKLVIFCSVCITMKGISYRTQQYTFIT